MNTKPKVSVIVLTYNEEFFIRQCLDFIVNQKVNFDYEVLVGDDCSSDGTQAIIMEFVEKYPHLIKPFFMKDRKEILGTNSRNVYSKITGEYLAICDGDDYWIDDQKLQLQVDYLDEHKDCSMCFHRFNTVYSYGDMKTYLWPTDEIIAGREKFTVDDILDNYFIASSSVMYRWMFTPQSFAQYCPVSLRPLDYFMSLMHAAHGNIGFIDRCMSQYNKHENGIWKNWHTGNFDDYLEFVNRQGPFMINFHKSVESYVANDKTLYRRKKVLSFVIDYYDALLNANEKDKAHDLISYYKEIPDDIISNKDKYDVPEFWELYSENRHRYYCSLKIQSIKIKNTDFPKEVYIYGAGEIGKKFVHYIMDKCNVLGFIDKYSIENRYAGVNIYQIANMSKGKLKDARIIISAPYYFKDIKKDLIESYGVAESNIESIDKYLSF